VVIVINKWDLVEDKLEPEDYVEYLTKELGGLTYAPLAFISATENAGVRDAVVTACQLYEQAGTRISTGQLNQVVRDMLSQRGPSPRLGKQAKVYYVTQPATHPPTIVMFVNDPKMFDNRYRRYMLNRFRESLDIAEVPIKLEIRPRRKSDRADNPVATS